MMRKLFCGELCLVLAVALCISLLPVTARADDKTLSNGETLTSIGAQNGDVVTIASGFTGEVKIPAGITSITLKSEGALSDVYITSEAAVTLTIDGLNITAPEGITDVFITTGSYSAINLAGISTLVVEGENTVTGGIERAGVHVSPAGELTIEGNGKLTAIGNHRLSNTYSGAGIGEDGDLNTAGQKGSGCGAITIRGNVTVYADKKARSSLAPSLGGKVSGPILIQGNAVVTVYNTSYVYKCIGSSITISGGSFDCGDMSPDPTNAQGEPLNLVEVPAGNEGTIAVKRIGDEAYSYTARTASDGSAKLWLPCGGSYEIRVNRGDHTDVYLVDSLRDFAMSGPDLHITSMVTLSTPYAQESHRLSVNSVATMPATYNSGTVTVTFSEAPVTAGVVEVSRDGFVTATTLAVQSGGGTATQTFGYSGLNANTTYKIRVRNFKDSDGYVNPVHDSADFSTAAIVRDSDSDDSAPEPRKHLNITTENDRYAGQRQGLVFTAHDVTMPQFQGAAVNLEPITEGRDFTRKAGSVVITLLPEYLDTLEDGEHLLSLTFAEHQGSILFYVNGTGAGQAAATDKPAAEAQQNNTFNPNTGL